MPTTKTKTVTQIAADGTVTTTTITKVTTQNGASSTTTTPLSAEEILYLESIKALTLGADGTMVPIQPGGPEAEEGSMGIATLDPENLQMAMVFVIKNGVGNYTEHWVEVDPRLLGGAGFRMISFDHNNNINWPAELANIKVKYNGLNGNLDWHDFRYAKVEAVYLAEPTQQAINNLPNMPPQHERRIFDLYTRSPIYPNGIKTGALYQDIFPIASLNRTEHWRLFSNFVFPDGGEGPPGGTGTINVLVPRSPVNSPPGTFPYPPTAQPKSVKEFLQECHGQGGSYIQTSYNWAPLT